MAKCRTIRERAAAEVCSLISEGYRRVATVEHPDSGRGMCTLRHNRNGNTACVRFSPYVFVVLINGKVVKSEGQACVGVLI